MDQCVFSDAHVGFCVYWLERLVLARLTGCEWASFTVSQKLLEISLPANPFLNVQARLLYA